jgi:hypothetical protein
VPARQANIRVAEWLESLRRCAFCWRQPAETRLHPQRLCFRSLGIGSCVAAFRLIDALLRRPLPISNSSELYVLSHKLIGLYGKPVEDGYWATPDFKLMRDAVKDQADLIAISDADRTDITWATDDDTEKAHVVYVSGNMFPLFGLEPALGRLLIPADDRAPDANLCGPLLELLESSLRRRSQYPWPLGPHWRPDLRNYWRGPRDFTGTEKERSPTSFCP